MEVLGVGRTAVWRTVLHICKADWISRCGMWRARVTLSGTEPTRRPRWRRSRVLIRLRVLGAGRWHCSPRPRGARPKCASTARIIQELESGFRGAGWNVIKVVWGSGRDKLLAKDKSGLLVQAH